MFIVFNAKKCWLPVMDTFRTVWLQTQSLTDMDFARPCGVSLVAAGIPHLAKGRAGGNSAESDALGQCPLTSHTRTSGTCRST